MLNTVAHKLKQLPPVKSIRARILEKSAKEHFDGIEDVAKVLRDSSVIDWDAYAARSGCRAMGYDPAFHYVLSGELEGYGAPDFDAKFYGRRYPDSDRLGPNKLYHYLMKGRWEGRYRSRAHLETPIPVVPNTQGRPIVFVFDHQASRTGAPILGWNLIERLKARYFVVSIVFSGGDLMEAFETAADVAILCPTLDGDRPPYFDKIIAAYRPAFAILNSCECRWVCPDLVRYSIPYVGLVQEFGCFYGVGGLKTFCANASALIFAAKVIMDSTIDNNPVLTRDKCHLQPQGRSRIPPISAPEARRKAASGDKTDIRAILRPPGEPRRFLVGGLGTVEARKGVDLFISAATNIIRRRPDLDIHFYWMGSEPKGAEHQVFLMYIDEQIARAGVESRVHLMPSTADIDAVYEELDVLFLSSRLDPMPNVCIDAAMAGTPVVCFDKGTGFAEVLEAHDDLKRLVVPHLDVGAAAKVIEELASDPALAAALGTSIRKMAETTFDMGAYLGLAEALGLKAAGLEAPSSAK